MKQSLIDKYNIPVPRYTSYPPANFFAPSFQEAAYIQSIKESNVQGNQNISFYIHIPFCKHLCHYCGCNSIPMMKTDVVERYVKAIHREIDLVTERIDKSRRISQIHYGGGTPTAIPLHHLKAINAHLLEAFGTIESPEIAIECHMGYLAEKDWQALVEAGFTRFSLGVQDFNPQVLKTVNRRPSLLPVDQIMQLLRASGASVNMDFIYGLPHQTVESFSTTMERAITLHPDRLVTFSYAHVPWVNKRQLILERAGLPTAVHKQQLFDTASVLLHKAGYRSIGMDHFVLETDELYRALQGGQLHRNFQGYCTRRTTGQVYAFGATGISQLEDAYAQNEKEIHAYMDRVERGELPIIKGYQLSHEERITREIIEMLMCNNRIDWRALSERLQLSVEELKRATAYDLSYLKEMAQDGLLSWTDDELLLKAEGLPFVRNVAASLDPLLKQSEKKYSKPI